MPVLNENISIKIKEVKFMSWDTANVFVAPRPYHALAFRIKGSADFTHGTCKFHTSLGDVFYMPANYSYSAEYKEENEIYVIHFDSDLKANMENMKLLNPHTVSVLFDKIYDVWQKKQSGYYYSALKIMCEILENISLQQIPKLSDKTIEAFESAVTYMNENYTSVDFSVRKMIKYAHMSDTYFRKLFFARFNTSPAKYLTLKRLTYAENLLSTGRYSVKEAAEAAGYCDVKYFSRVVKSEYGIPPSKLYQHDKTQQ